MIIVCPECSARYLVGAHALGGEGRNVRCGHCAHTWFQAPDAGGPDIADDVDDPVFPDIDDDFPQSIRPDESDNLPALTGDAKMQALIGRATGAMAAICIFAFIWSILLGMQSTISRAWPASALLYQSLGYEVSVPGQGLAFDRVSAVYDPGTVPGDERDRGTLRLEGRLINLGSAPVDLAPVKVTLRRENRVEAGQVLFTFPREAMKGEESFKFAKQIKGIPPNIAALDMQFMPFSERAGAPAKIIPVE